MVGFMLVPGIFWGCRKDLERLKDIVWEPEFVIPLASSKLYAEDGIRVTRNVDSYVDSQNVVVLVYQRVLDLPLTGTGNPVPFQDTVNVSLFYNLESGTIYFANPSVRIRFLNYIPAQLSVTILGAEAMQKGTGMMVPIVSNVFNQAISIPAGSSSLPSEQVVRMDTTNSNLAQIISLPPVKVAVWGSIMVPSGVSGTFRIQTRVELPFYGYADSAILRDTFNVDVPDLSPYKNMRLIIYAENHFHLRLGYELVLVDSAMNVVEVLRPAELGWIPPVSGGSPGTAEQTISLDESRIQRLQNVRYGILRAFMHSVDAQNQRRIYIYADQYLYVTLSLYVQLRERVSVSSAGNP